MRVHGLGIVGGILGLLSLPLPWLSLTFEGGIATGSAFDTFELLALLRDAFVVAPGLGVAIILLVVGVLLVLIGAIVAFLHPGGGSLLLVGGILGLIGGAWIGSVLSIVPGFSATPGVGAFLALIAGVVALCGLGVQGLLLYPRPRPIYMGYRSPYGVPTLAAPVPAAVPPPRGFDPLPPSENPSRLASPFVALEPGWAQELHAEIRGLERAIEEQRGTLSRIAIEFANGYIDEPGYDAQSLDHSERIAALERSLASKRGDLYRGLLPPPPPDEGDPGPETGPAP